MTLPPPDSTRAVAATDAEPPLSRPKLAPGDVAPIGWLAAAPLLVARLAVAAGALLMLGLHRPRPTSESPLPPASTPTVRIPAGTFSMGSVDGHTDEQPVHEERVAGFEIDETEVTVGRYLACVDAGTCKAPPHRAGCNWGPERDAYPINCVTHARATTYCQWVGKRLPTEVEWEYAARGHDGRVFPWGNEAPVVGVCWRREDGKSSCPAGASETDVSPFGVRDLGGNVAEWTSSVYCVYAPDGACTSQLLAIRGGHFGDTQSRQLRAAGRERHPATASSSVVGFRCTRLAPHDDPVS